MPKRREPRKDDPPSQSPGLVLNAIRDRDGEHLAGPEWGNPAYAEVEARCEDIMREARAAGLKFGLYDLNGQRLAALEQRVAEEHRRRAGGTAPETGRVIG